MVVASWPLRWRRPTATLNSSNPAAGASVDAAPRKSR
jgi:hypothetical protein